MRGVLSSLIFQQPRNFKCILRQINIGQLIASIKINSDYSDKCFLLEKNLTTLLKLIYKQG